MSFYSRILRPLLFSLPPEAAHELTTRLLKLPGMAGTFRSPHATDESLGKEVFGLHFPNPVGLAAGFDKNARFFEAMGTIGFGFVEVGTVTPRPQPGNPKPRMFRLPKDQALVNRMGFNNEGIAAMKHRLQARRPGGPVIGGNIGKNKDTSNENALEDYLHCFRKLQPYVDYFVVNVSSPNTPGLRSLQEKEPLKRLLEGVQQENAASDPRRPLLLKIAPDLTQEQLDDILDIAAETRLDGLIATNTTIIRDHLKTSAAQLERIGGGGLSGQPLEERATEVIHYLTERTRGELPIVGVGGIFSPQDALEKLEAGASLIQLYTGFVYEGPGLLDEVLGVLGAEN